MEQATKAKTHSSTLTLTSELDGGGWWTPRSGRYTPEKRLSTHYIWGWVDPI